MSALFVERFSPKSNDLAARSPVVLLHGWAMNAEVWGLFPQSLATQREVYRVELPGHGRSPWSGEERLERWADQVGAVVPAGAVWAGWSLGATVAMRAALDSPGHIRALLLFNGTPRFVQAADWPHAMTLQALMGFAQSLTDDPRATIKRFLALQVRGAIDAGATLRRLNWAMREVPMARQEALVVGLELLRATDLRRSLPALELPTLWLLGERDALVPAAMGWCLTDWLPDAHVEVIEGAGHAPFLSHLAPLMSRVESFLEQLDG